MEYACAQMPTRVLKTSMRVHASQKVHRREKHEGCIVTRHHRVATPIADAREGSAQDDRHAPAKIALHHVRCTV